MAWAERGPVTDRWTRVAWSRWKTGWGGRLQNLADHRQSVADARRAMDSADTAFAEAGDGDRITFAGQTSPGPRRRSPRSSRPRTSPRCGQCGRAAARVAAAEPGTRAVLNLTFEDGISHLTVVQNHNGTIQWVDPLTGRVSRPVHCWPERRPAKASSRSTRWLPPLPMANGCHLTVAHWQCAAAITIGRRCRPRCLPRCRNPAGYVAGPIGAGPGATEESTDPGLARVSTNIDRIARDAIGPLEASVYPANRRLVGSHHNRRPEIPGGAHFR